MIEHVQDREFYQVFRRLPYNRNQIPVVGARLIFGGNPNPFWAFYETPQTMTVNTDDGPVQVPAIKFLNHVKQGRITPSQLPDDAYNIAQHFQMLAREILFEAIRKEVAPDSPSRHTCAWGVRSYDEAVEWASHIGNGTAILRMSVNGKLLEVDAAQLPGDSSGYSEWVRRSTAYWRCEMSADPRRELLFEGEAVVNRVTPV